MTDRIADPQVVCPFVAFDDERDFRASVPDHRHRCFAETPAAPRALAHQAAYCLSASFPACPTFADWARREAAPVRVESPVRSLRDAGGTPRTGTASVAAASVAAAAAPEPAAGAVPPAGTRDELPTEDAAARPAAVPPAAPPVADEAPAFLAGRSTRPPAPVPPSADEAWAPPPDDRAGDEVDLPADRYADPAAPVAEPRRMPVGYAPVAVGRADRRPVAGASAHSGREHRDASAPSWEEPRRHEAYPTLKSRGSGGIPRPLGFALVILLAGVALFAAPFILRGLGGAGEEAGASPTPAASVEPTATPLPTPVPTPETVVYIVKANDTLSKIAARFDVTVDQILAANPQIKNANQIAVGDEIVIPPPAPAEVVDDGVITPAP